MASEYPNIMGLQIGMLSDDLNNIISNLGYSLLDNDNDDDLNFVIKSEKNANYVLSVVFIMNHLYKWTIRDWKDFLGFSNEMMSFTDLIDVFKNYFLKNYEYEFSFSPSSRLIICSNQKWIIQFALDYEEIDIIKR